MVNYHQRSKRSAEHCKNLSKMMKRVWKNRKNGHYLVHIEHHPKYVIKTTITGYSKNDLLRKLSLIKEQVKKEI